MTTFDLPGVLAALADVCRQSEQRFRRWAQEAHDADLHALLLRRVEERAAAAAELQRHLAWLDGGAEAGAPEAGAGRATSLARRRATPVSTPVSLLVPGVALPACPARHVPPPGASAERDIALLAECEACEVWAINAYWHALQAPLPRRLRLLLQNQYAAVKRSHRRALVLRYLALDRLDAAMPSGLEAPLALGSALPPSREASHAG